MKNLCNKLVNNIKKHDVLIVVLLFAMLTSKIVLSIHFNITDELWNFANIYKMYNGAQIYTESNVIITPLFFYIGNIFLHILGANYLTFRFYGIVIFTSLFSLMYILFKKLKLSKKYAFISTMILLCIIYQLVPVGANYNVLALVFIILGILVQISKLNPNTKCILQGIIIFLTFYTKQNTGIYYMLGIIAYGILNMAKTKEYKKQLWGLFKEFFLALILLVISLYSLYIKGNLNDFINYTILGITEFRQNTFWSVGNAVQSILQMLFVIMSYILLNIINPLEKDEKQNIEFILVIAIACLLIQYPLNNTYHYLCSLTMLMILEVYVIMQILANYKKFDCWVKRINILVAIIIIVMFSVNTITYINKLKDSKLKGTIYFGSNMSDELYEDNKEICNYILAQKKQGIDVKIISERAMFYNSILKINNKEFDLSFLGNLGKEGENGLINKIRELKNAKILIIKNEEDMHYQESKNIRQYIMNNLEKEGEIGEFCIYKK